MTSPTPQPPLSRRRPRSAARVVLLGALLALVATVIWRTSGNGLWPVRGPRVIVLYCYSILDGVMSEGLLPAFADRWREDRDETVEFVTTYAGSGELTNLLLRRYPAEVAVLSSELDAYRLANIQIRWESWRALPHEGVVSRTPIVILVREGNPRGIRDFPDLLATGVGVVLPDPATSGAGNWSLLAVYGAALRRSGDQERARADLAALEANVVALPASAREARKLFASGTGDALLTYEQDLLAAPGRGAAAGEIVYPRRTILTANVVTRIDKNIDERQRPLVAAFVDFLWSRRAQELLVDQGFHSVLPELDAHNPSLGAVEDLFTLEELGGATRARREILDRAWGRRGERGAAR